MSVEFRGRVMRNELEFSLDDLLLIVMMSSNLS